MATFYPMRGTRRKVATIKGDTVTKAFRTSVNNARTRTHTEFAMGELMDSTATAMKPRVNQIQVRTVPETAVSEVRVQYAGSKVYSAT